MESLEVNTNLLQNPEHFLNIAWISNYGYNFLSEILYFYIIQNCKGKYNISFFLFSMFHHHPSWVCPVQLNLVCWLVSLKSRVHYSISLYVVAQITAPISFVIIAFPPIFATPLSILGYILSVKMYSSDDMRE